MELCQSSSQEARRGQSWLDTVTLSDPALLSSPNGRRWLDHGHGRGGLLFPLSFSHHQKTDDGHGLPSRIG